jgi:hypothetical protein
MPAQTDFLQWNPNATNQESDAAYAADGQRSGGASNPSVFSSLTANKAFYQWSTMVQALAWMLVQKGYSPVDGTSPLTASGTPSTAVTNLANVLSNIFTKADLQFPIVNGVPVTVTNPGAGTHNGQVVTIPVGFVVGVGQVLRIRYSCRLASGGGGAGISSVNLSIGSTLIHGFNGDLQSGGDGVVVEHMLAVISGGQGVIYTSFAGQSLGVSVAGGLNFQNGAIPNLTAGTTLTSQLVSVGSNTSVYSFDFLTLENLSF